MGDMIGALLGEGLRLRVLSVEPDENAELVVRIKDSFDVVHAVTLSDEALYSLWFRLKTYKPGPHAFLARCGVQIGGPSCVLCGKVPGDPIHAAPGVHQ